MKFGDSKIDAFIAVDVPVQFNSTLKRPGQRGTKPVETAAPSVDVAELRRQWTSGVDESFRTWAYSVPDEVFLRFIDGVHESQMKECWKSSSEAASRVLYNIATNGDTSPTRKVSMEELIAYEDYLKLDVPSQWTARYAIENLQRQTASGEWTLSQHRK